MAIEATIGLQPKVLRMEQDIKENIKEIIDDIKCPRAFCCMDIGFDKPCKTKEIGLETFLECLEERPDDCPFSLSYSGMFLCECPLRVYICKNLRK